jgi:ketosteroid isomerase-like protein
MKIRTVVALVGSAIGFALPIFAQQQDTVAPEVRQQIEAVLMKFDEAYNNHDAAAIADLFTLDAVEVFAADPASAARGTAVGQQAIKKRYESESTESSATNMAHKLVQVYALGNDICAFAERSIMVFKGHSLVIYVRDADTWKIRMAYDN